MTLRSSSSSIQAKFSIKSAQDAGTAVSAIAIAEIIIGLARFGLEAFSGFSSPIPLGFGTMECLKQVQFAHMIAFTGNPIDSIQEFSAKLEWANYNLWKPWLKGNIGSGSNNNSWDCGASSDLDASLIATAIMIAVSLVIALLCRVLCANFHESMELEKQRLAAKGQRRFDRRLFKYISPKIYAAFSWEVAIFTTQLPAWYVIVGNLTSSSCQGWIVVGLVILCTVPVPYLCFCLYLAVSKVARFAEYEEESATTGDEQQRQQRTFEQIRSKLLGQCKANRKNITAQLEMKAQLRAWKIYNWTGQWKWRYADSDQKKTRNEQVFFGLVLPIVNQHRGNYRLLHCVMDQLVFAALGCFIPITNVRARVYLVLAFVAIDAISRGVLQPYPNKFANTNQIVVGILRTLIIIFLAVEMEGVMSSDDAANAVIICNILAIAIHVACQIPGFLVGCWTSALGLVNLVSISGGIGCTADSGIVIDMDSPFENDKNEERQQQIFNVIAQKPEDHIHQIPMHPYPAIVDNYVSVNVKSGECESFSFHSLQSIHVDTKNDDGVVEADVGFTTATGGVVWDIDYIDPGQFAIKNDDSDGDGDGKNGVRMINGRPLMVIEDPKIATIALI